MRQRGLAGRRTQKTTVRTGLPFGNPLDFLAADHLTLCRICADLTALVETDTVGTDRVEAIRGFPGEGLADHLADENQDLFPLLRQKCLADDDTVSALDRLCADHTEIQTDLQGVLTGLNRVVDPHEGFTRQEADIFAAFSAFKLRHVIVETAIVLPIARGRLSLRDLRHLSDRMLCRRGLDRLMVRAGAA